MVKARVQLWPWLKETNIDSRKEMESEHLIPVTKFDILSNHPDLLPLQTLWLYNNITLFSLLLRDRTGNSYGC